MDFKFKLLILIFLGISSFSVSAQVFAPVGATWNYISCTSNVPPRCNCVKSNQPYIVRGDTVISGKNVKIVKAGEDEIYVYDDSSKIYVFEADSFYLQMDLNLSEGDTLKHVYTENISSFDSPFNLSCQCKGMSHVELFSIVQKDTVISIDGNQLKQLWFNSYVKDTLNDTLIFNYSFKFTEFIGAEYGYDQNTFGFGIPINIFGTPVEGCLLGFCCSNELLCYEDNNLTYDYSIKSSSCTYTSIDDLSPDAIQVYPNPAQSTWCIHSEKPGILEVYNLSGKEILNRHIQTGIEHINISPFAGGIYFYKISSKNGELMKSGKLVKQ